MTASYLVNIQLCITAGHRNSNKQAKDHRLKISLQSQSLQCWFSRNVYNRTSSLLIKTHCAATTPTHLSMSFKLSHSMCLCAFVLKPSPVSGHARVLWDATRQRVYRLRLSQMSAVCEPSMVNRTGDLGSCILCLNLKKCFQHSWTEAELPRIYWNKRHGSSTYASIILCCEQQALKHSASDPPFVLCVKLANNTHWN